MIFFLLFYNFIKLGYYCYDFFYIKIDCKEQNGYSIKPDLSAATAGGGAVGGWGTGAPVRPSVCTPDMTRHI